MIPRLIIDHGTISVENGSLIATGTGTAWSSILDRGAFIFVGTEAKPALVASRRIRTTDLDPESEAAGTFLADDELYFADEWHGSTAAGASYIAVVFGGHAELSEDMASLMSVIGASGLVGPTTSGAPLNSVGRNNEIRFDTVSRVIYQRLSGVWTQISALIPFNFMGAYAAPTTYAAGDWVQSGSYNYVSNVAGNIGNTPNSAPASSAYWTYIPMPAAGNLFDIGLFISGRPVDGVTIYRHVFRTGANVTFAASFANSKANAEDASTGTAVFTIYKNGVSVGTITFTTDDDGVYAGAGGVFGAGDILTVVAPSPRDTTLANISLTLAGTKTT